MNQPQRQTQSETHLNSPTLVGWRIQKERERDQKSAVHRQLLEQRHAKNPN